MNTTQYSREDVGLLLIRAILAAVFLFHGSQKLFGIFDGPGLVGFAGWLESLNVPMPTLNAYLATFAEVFGGLALLVGFQVRLASIPLAITMLVGAVTAHSGFNFTKGGMEYPLTLATVLVALFLIGGGKLTLGNLLSSNERSLATA